MYHLFRLNVHRKGYVLYSGTESSSLQEHPLDLKTDGISHNYLNAQRRIDVVSGLDKRRWHICVSNVSPGERPVVAYGALLPISDERGRAGLSFLHAVESESIEDIVHTVRRINNLLTVQAIDEITASLAMVADGRESAHRIIEHFIAQFSQPLLGRPMTSMVSSRPIKEIRHDCGGAQAIAWLAMTVSHLRTNPPWEIFDRYDQQAGQLLTESSSSAAVSRYLLSDYLYAAVDYLRLVEAFCESRAHRHPEETVQTHTFMQGQRASIPPFPVSASKTASQNPRSNSATEQVYQPQAYSPSTETQRKTKSPNVVPARMDGLYGDELYLLIPSSGDRLRVKAKHCRSISDESNIFRIRVERLKWLGLAIEEFDLVLHKEELSARNLSDLEAFRKRVDRR